MSEDADWSWRRFWETNFVVRRRTPNQEDGVATTSSELVLPNYHDPARHRGFEFSLRWGVAATYQPTTISAGEAEVPRPPYLQVYTGWSRCRNHFTLLINADSVVLETLIYW